MKQATKREMDPWEQRRERQAALAKPRPKPKPKQKENPWITKCEMQDARANPPCLCNKQKEEEKEGKTSQLQPVEKKNMRKVASCLVLCMPNNVLATHHGCTRALDAQHRGHTPCEIMHGQQVSIPVHTHMSLGHDMLWCKCACSCSHPTKKRHPIANKRETQKKRPKRKEYTQFEACTPHTMQALHSGTKLNPINGAL